MAEIQCNVTASALAQRQHAHDVARMIESFGLTDEQRAVLIMDLVRCFEKQELVSALWASLSEHMSDLLVSAE